MVKVHGHSEIDKLLAQRVVDAGVAPNAAAAVAWIGEDGAWCCATGRAGGRENIFDIASLTKPVLAMTGQRLARRGVLSLADPLDRWLPQSSGRPAGGLSLETLLAHRSGLKPHVEFFAPLRNGTTVTREAILRAAADSERDDPGPADRAVYSDLGYLLVGCALESAGGADLDALMKGEVAEPLDIQLGSARQWLEDEPNFRQRVAPTEEIDWRGGLIRGEVHDENAWALSGTGACGHAGLFATVEAVAGLGMATLDALNGKLQAWLSPTQIEELARARPGGSLRAGFDGKSEAGSSAGTRLGRNTVGHLGFTRTSFWCDPDAQIVVVLLTNRVCPTRDNPALKTLRPAIHDALFDLAGPADRNP